MNRAVATSRIRAALEAYADPYLGCSLGQAKAVGQLELRGRDAFVELKFGFPCADYDAELYAALCSHLQPLIDAGRLHLDLQAEITAHAVQKT